MSISVDVRDLNLSVSNWIACCCNSDCTKMAIFHTSVNTKGIYISLDSGTSFTAVVSANLPNTTATNYFRGATCSHDFTKIIGVRDQEGIYYSTDSGTSWTKSNAPTKFWSSVAGSADLSIAYAVGYSAGGMGFYKSTDYGATWNVMYTPLQRAWFVCCSWDARYVGIAMYDGTNNTSNYGIYRSSNYGIDSWSGYNLQKSSTATYFRAICCSSDFQTVAAIGNYSGNFSKLWISTDYGGTWTIKDDNIFKGVNLNTVAISGSYNLQKMVICVYDASSHSTNVLFSTDYGNSWRNVHATGISWHATCFSKTTDRALVLQNGPNAYILDFYSGKTLVQNGAVLINVKNPDFNDTISVFTTNQAKPLLNIRNSSPIHNPVTCRYNASNQAETTRLNNYTTVVTTGSIDINNNVDNLHYYWKTSGGTKYRYGNSVNSTLFTGQHKTLPDDPNIKINLNEHVGLIMSSNDTGYTSCDISNNTYSGKRAIYINETLPNCSLSIIDEDPCVFGVITNNPNGSNGSDDDSTTEFCTRLIDSVRVNSLGEGALWVSNINGPIKNGDWITTSQIPGVGKKQSEMRRCNYTVAKATMSCDFENGSDKYKTKLIEFKGQTYIMAFIGVTYHCG